MEYRHTLLEGEIKTGRLNFGASRLPDEAIAWFEANAGQNVGIYLDDGTLIKRSIRIDRYKANSWRFNCGIYTFEGKVPGSVVIIRDRDDGNLEISFDDTIEAVPAPRKPLARTRVCRAGAREILGELINFRGLQHAPVNEQGVVFLFGMVCRELGYLVEVVRSRYPDCEAKRLVNTSPETWERVRVEFEYQSANFEQHGHDPSECDVLVCWEHNWPECPIEVLELREEIKHLQEEGIP